MSASLAPTGRGPEVVDLSTARHARQARTASWFCPSCDLVAEGFTPTECAYLAAVHDQVQHGSRRTTIVYPGAAIPVPPTNLESGLSIGA
jgi:hypothetical protein